MPLLVNLLTVFYFGLFMFFTYSKAIPDDTLEQVEAGKRSNFRTVAVLRASAPHWLRFRTTLRPLFCIYPLLVLLFPLFQHYMITNIEKTSNICCRYLMIYDCGVVFKINRARS